MEMPKWIAEEAKIVKTRFEEKDYRGVIEEFEKLWDRYHNHDYTCCIDDNTLADSTDWYLDEVLQPYCNKIINDLKVLRNGIAEVQGSIQIEPCDREEDQQFKRELDALANKVRMAINAMNKVK